MEGAWGHVPHLSSLRRSAQGRGRAQSAARLRSWARVSPLPWVTRAPCPQFLAFTCGLLRGTLSTLGIKSLVTASVASLPTCESWGGGALLPTLKGGGGSELSRPPTPGLGRQGWGCRVPLTDGEFEAQRA